MTKNQFEFIVKWQNEKFTKATPLSCINHLEEEVRELKDDIEKGVFRQEELADCFLLLIGVTNKLNINYDRLCEILDTKMKINLSRVWGEVNELGYVKHVK